MVITKKYHEKITSYIAQHGDKKILTIYIEKHQDFYIQETWITKSNEKGVYFKTNKKLLTKKEFKKWLLICFRSRVFP